jgi:hypothetical protein
MLAEYMVSVNEVIRVRQSTVYRRTTTSEEKVAARFCTILIRNGLLDHFNSSLGGAEQWGGVDESFDDSRNQVPYILQHEQNSKFVFY